MARGIAFFGLNGAGKSTLAHALAKETGFFEMDAEDYYFPEQRASRAQALECAESIKTEHLGALPFSVSRTKDEAEAAMLTDMRAHPRFILAGVTLRWRSEILEQIAVAFLVETPAQERARRIQSREEKRFGARVLPGGDMYAQQSEFRAWAQARDPQLAEDSAKELRCPVVRLNGLLPLEENLRIIRERIAEIIKK
ncbi:MAG: hypothetical protein Q4A66_11675 [Eubacteriales bacterium]|nr:hypothetical protein [Eubacteriales bacterium]